MEQSFQKGVVLHLASLIEYTEGGVISKQLIKSPAGNITLFSFDKGESIVMPAGLPHACARAGIGRGSEYYCKRNSVHRKSRRKYRISGECAACPYSSGEI